MKGTTVPTDQILNANPAWVRQGIERNLGPLIRDIEANGIQIPVLLAPDFFVIDGARRVCAASALGLKRVPTLVTSDWAVIIRHLAFARENGGSTARPWSWLETYDLLHRVLPPLYKETRAQRMVQSRQTKTPKRRGRALYLQELAKALGTTAAALQSIQDIGSVITRARSLDQELAERIIRQVTEVENTTHGVYSAQRTARDVLTRYINNVSYEPNKKTAKDQERVVNGIVVTLDHVKKEALSLAEHPFNPAVSVDELKDALKRLTSFRMQMRTFVQRINDHIEKYENQGERESDSKPG